MSGIDTQNLGHDIVLYDGNEPSVLHSLAYNRRRFMDVLWLPCPPSYLSTEQIMVTSRFRESRLDGDPQFKHAALTRRTLLGLLSAVRNRSVLEIGCGKFPLASDVQLASYRGIEIDPVAIDHCRKMNLEVGTLTDFAHKDDAQFDIAVSLYVFHFAIDRALGSYIDRHLHDTGCLLFNLIADDGADLLAKLALLSRFFPSIRVVKTDLLSAREFFVVMSRPAANQQAARLVDALEDLLRAPTKSPSLSGGS